MPSLPPAAASPDSVQSAPTSPGSRDHHARRSIRNTIALLESIAAIRDLEHLSGEESASLLAVEDAVNLLYARFAEREE
jgi:hypothetical protein